VILNAPINRNRAIYAVMIAAVIVLGMASRSFAWLLPPLLKKNAGDILWATMVFFLIGLLLPRLTTNRTALAAALFSILVEFFKLYHALVLDGLRETVLGRLIFGYGFSWSNLVCYLIGITVGVMVEQVTERR